MKCEAVVMSRAEKKESRAGRQKMKERKWFFRAVTAFRATVGVSAMTSSIVCRWSDQSRRDCLHLSPFSVNTQACMSLYESVCLAISDEHRVALLDPSSCSRKWSHEWLPRKVCSFHFFQVRRCDSRNNLKCSQNKEQEVLSDGGKEKTTISHTSAGKKWEDCGHIVWPRTCTKMMCPMLLSMAPRWAHNRLLEHNHCLDSAGRMECK